MAVANSSTMNDTLLKSSGKTFSTMDVKIAQIVLEVAILVAVMFQKVQDASMRRLMNILLVFLWFGVFLLSLHSFIHHGMDRPSLAVYVSDVYETVSLFISLFLCYPMIVFIHKQVKFHVIFLLLFSVLVGGVIVNLIKTGPGTSSGFHNIALMLTFLFTFYLYFQLKSYLHLDGHEGYLKDLSSLMAIELTLIFLNGLAIILFYSGSNHFLQSVQLSVTMVRYLKLYILMSMLATLNITADEFFHL